jgi:hypothetical protein
MSGFATRQGLRGRKATGARAVNLGGDAAGRAGAC